VGHYLDGVPDELGSDLDGLGCADDLRRQAQDAAVAGRNDEAIELLLKAHQAEQKFAARIKLQGERA